MKLNDSGEAGFHISDDGTSDNQLAVNKCLDENENSFENTYQILPRDKVTIFAQITTRSNVGLYDGNLFKQVHPSYQLHLNDASGDQTLDLRSLFGVENYFNWNIHCYNYGNLHLAAGESSWFEIIEKYSDDPNYEKTFRGPVGEDYYTISWESQYDIPLTAADNGSKMCVDTEGDQYSVFVMQVEGGPTLTIGGFDTPKFYLYDGETANVLDELVLDTSDYFFKANNVPMQNGQRFWISKGLNGPNATVYGSASNDNETINSSNKYNVPVKKDGINFKMGATGTFNFEFFIADNGSGRAYINVNPTAGEWPRNLSLCKNYNTVGSFVYDPETDTYSAPLNLEDGDVFWVSGDDGTFFGLSNADNRIFVNRFNSTSIPTQVGDGAEGDYTSLLKAAVPGDVILKVKLSDDGQNATLTIDWPEPIFKIQTQDEYVTFTKDADGDNYSAELTVTSSMTNADGFFTFDIIDASSSEWAYYGIPSTYYLTRHNSQNVPLGSGEEGHHNISLPIGTYTLTINTDGTLSVEWPEPNYQLAWRENNLSEIVYMPLSYDEETGIWKNSNLTLRQGNQIWVVDANSSRSWGMEPCPECSENLIISKSNSTNIQLTNTGFIPTISGDSPFLMTVTIEEDPNSNNLIMNVSGWSDPGFYLYYYTGWTSAGVSNLFQPDQYLSDTYTLWKELKDVYTEKSYMFTILHVDDSGAWTYYNPTSSDGDFVNLDLNNSIPLTPSESATPMFLAEPDNYLFKLMNSPNGTYLTVEAKEKMYSVITNGDVEGSDMSCFYKKEGGGQIVPATYSAGAGKNGSRGIVVQSRDISNTRWDTEFFIRANQPLPEGTRYHIAFDYKASQEAGSESHCHAEPGYEITSQGIGSMTMDTEWKHFESEGTILHAQSPSDNMQTVTFLLALNENATTYYFDNIVFEIDYEHLDVPMTDIVINGDIEGENMSCFYKKEIIEDETGDFFSTDIIRAPYTEGTGVNSSRGIVVNSSKHATYIWDTGFFIRLTQTLPEGTKYRISFDIKADKYATVQTQVHAEPGDYIFYEAIGNIDVTPDWQHITRTGVITAAQSPANKPMRTFTFNMNDPLNDVNTFYFDNIKVEIDNDHVNNVLMGDVNGDGSVTIQDVVLLVDYTLNKPVTGFVIEAADVTGDSQINISDVVAIVNLVLKKN